MIEVFPVQLAEVGGGVIGLAKEDVESAENRGFAGAVRPDQASVVVQRYRLVRKGSEILDSYRFDPHGCPSLWAGIRIAPGPPFFQ